MTISNIEKKIKKLETERELLIKQLLNSKDMVKGSYGEIFRKCGKATCQCAKGEGHLFCRITWSEKGKPKTKAIPKEDITWIRLRTDAYAVFRKQRHKLRLLDMKLKDELNDFENEIVKKTKTAKTYFNK